MRIVVRSVVGAAVEVGALVPVPVVDSAAWIRHRLGEGGFASETLEESVTTCGWPVLVAHGTRGGVPTLRVFFRFGDLGGVAEACGDLATAWAALREARPAYDELAAIHQLFA